MAVSPNVVPAIVLLPSEMEGGAPQSTTGRIRIAIKTELALIKIGLGTEGGGPRVIGIPNIGISYLNKLVEVPSFH